MPQPVVFGADQSIVSFAAWDTAQPSLRVRATRGLRSKSICLVSATPQSAAASEVMPVQLALVQTRRPADPNLRVSSEAFLRRGTRRRASDQLADPAGSAVAPCSDPN